MKKEAKKVAKKRTPKPQTVTQPFAGAEDQGRDEPNDEIAHLLRHPHCCRKVYVASVAKQIADALLFFGEQEDGATQVDGVFSHIKERIRAAQMHEVCKELREVEREKKELEAKLQSL